jgi:hypothetical protein
LRLSNRTAADRLAEAALLDAVIDLDEPVAVKVENRVLDRAPEQSLAGSDTRRIGLPSGADQSNFTHRDHCCWRRNPLDVQMKCPSSLSSSTIASSRSGHARSETPPHSTYRRAASRSPRPPPTGENAGVSG